MDILIVDDDRDSRATLVKVLERAGFSVRAVENGLQALAALQEDRVKAVVCDIQMAFLDGRHLFQELERLDPELASHVLFVTGHYGESDIAEFIERTGQLVVQKPYEIDELLRGVRAAMRRPARRSHPTLSVSLARARRLPDLFRAATGDPEARVATLVRRYWMSMPEHARRELAERLLPVLRPADDHPDLPVLDEVRDACAGVVEAWFLQHEAAERGETEADADAGA